MKALLDTNIIINREANRVTNQDIGILYKWLDKTSYQKCVHRVSINEIEKNPNKDTVETFKIKLESYEVLETQAKMADEVKIISSSQDIKVNDVIDTILLNELFQGRVDILITEDKKMHVKADKLKLSNKVFTINSFLEYIYSEYPELIDYDILSVKKVRMGEIDIQDPFFDSLKEDYIGFEKWFNRKANEFVYITVNESNNLLLSFLYLKVEGSEEDYKDIIPTMLPKKRLKIGTFKVVSNGVRLGERFLKIIFDNAIIQKTEEIYVTVFDKRDEQKRLISLLEDWGFSKFGTKGNLNELIYIRDFSKTFEKNDPKKSYPYYSLSNSNIYLIPIYPEYHTELIPDSILHNESKENFRDSKPHSNAISKVYISRSLERDINTGDILVFYRTGGYFKSVVTTISIVDNVYKEFASFDDFKNKCKKRSVLTDNRIKEFWNYNKNIKPFIINFLYTYSLPIRLNLKTLIQLGVINDINDAPRGLKKISINDFYKIIEKSKSNTSYIIH